MADTSTMPNPLAPDRDKKTTEYGLRIMRSAYEKWSKGMNESFQQRKGRYEYNRLFASGKQPMEEYKDILDVGGNMAVINLAYDPLPIAIPFINRLYDRYMQRIEKIQCNAIDPLSQTKREKAKDQALFKLKEKENIQAIQQAAGVQLEEFSETDPEDEKELEIEFGFNYKEREEVIMEQGIDIVLYDNQWSDVIKKRILYDFITAGISQVKVYIDGSGRIKISFTKPENIISSYSEWEDFRDWQWQGEYVEYSISEIRLLYPGKISEEDLYKLAISMKGRNGNPNNLNDSWNPEWNQSVARPYDAFVIPCVSLSFKTLQNLKYEVKNDRFGKEILDEVKTIKPDKKYVQSQTYYVEYCGVWVIDTNHVLEWGLAKNMIKPESNLSEIKSPYITFMPDNNKMTNKPLIEMMIPSIKMMQLTHLQQQKIIAAAAPDGFKVDISTMSDISLGEGMEDLTPYDLYKIYKQTGIQYYKAIDDADEWGTQKRQEPIQPLNVPFSGKLEQLMGVWNQEYDKLLRIVGSNPLDAGQITNQAVGKQVLQDARQMSESASNFLYRSYLNMLKRTSTIIMYRLWDILVYGKKFNVKYYDGYRQALGEERVEYVKIEATDDFEKTQFDVKVEAVIDDNEQQLFEQNVQNVLAGDPSMLPVVTEARRLAKTNLKYATAYLMAKFEKRRRQAMEEKQLDIQQQSQSAIAAAQATSQGQMQLEQLKAELKAQATKEELEAEKEKEISKFASILKTKVVEGMLQQGKTIEEIEQAADWVFDGIGIISKSQKQIMVEDMIENEREMQMEELSMQQQQQPQEEVSTEPMQ